MRSITAVAVTLATASILGCSDNGLESENLASSQSEDEMDQPANPFFAPSELQFQFPPFDRIDNDDYLPAFEAGMRAQLEEVEAIATNTQPPTLENTIVAYERSGQLLMRVARVFYSMSSAHTNDRIREIEAEIAPRLAEHEDSILLDERLFARVEAIYSARDDLDVDAETRRLVGELIDGRIATEDPGEPLEGRVDPKQGY